MLRDIDKDTVDFQLNFDDTLKEPTVLPTRIPNLLVNGHLVLPLVWRQICQHITLARCWTAVWLTLILVEKWK